MNRVVPANPNTNSDPIPERTVDPPQKRYSHSLSPRFLRAAHVRLEPQQILSI